MRHISLSTRVLFGCAAALAASALACADLGFMEEGACGNAVIDLTEDCDTYSRPEDPEAKCAGPEGPSACRYVCRAADGAHPCPSGFGCGLDGICRRASGSFTSMGDSVSLPSLRAVLAGDFDGEGTPDILAMSSNDPQGRRSARLIYPPKGGAPARDWPLYRLVALPAVGSLGQDRPADLAFADIGGVAILRGRPHGLPEVAAFPSLLEPDGTTLRAIPLDALPSRKGDEIVALISAEGQTRLVGYDDVTSVETLLTDELPGGEEALSGDIAWGKLDEHAPCPQIVLPYKGRGEVLVFAPCRVEGEQVVWNDHGATRAVSLLGGAKIDRGARLVDMDLDGDLDLLIGASGETFIAWGRGDGSFTSAPQDGEADTASPYLLPAEVGDEQLPLAIADVNADGVMDFVVPAGVVLSHADGHAFAYHKLGNEWTTAVVADLNANGLLDVVAGSSSALDLDFLNNAGGSVLSHAPLPTDGAPVHLAVGDFDGDLVNDLACAQAFTEKDRTTMLMTVGFGMTQGPPWFFVTMARIEEIKQISAARLPTARMSDATEAVADGISDLVIVAQGGPRETDTLFALQGSGARGVTAPLPLRSKDGDAVPLLGLAIGRFGGGVPSLAALSCEKGSAPANGGASAKGGDAGEEGTAGKEQLRLWNVQGVEQLTLSSLVASDPLSEGFKLPSDGCASGSSFAYGAVIAAGDLRRSPSGDEAMDEVVVVAPFGEAGGVALVIADEEVGGLKLVPRPARPIAGGAELSPYSVLALHDVDGDGGIDAVLSTASSEVAGSSGTAQGDKPAGDILVLWNDGAGGLDTDAPSRIHIAGGATGFGCLPSPSGRGCDLVVTSRAATYRAAVAERRFAVAPIDDLPGGEDVAVGDFDRDGVADVAIGSEGDLYFYRAAPVLP